MAWFIGSFIVAALLWLMLRRRARRQSVATVAGRVVADLSMLPPQFVIFDLEATGLDPDRHEIIEIGAIRANRDSEHHTTFRTLVVPTGRISARITEITGIDREMVKNEGMSLAEAIEAFRCFVGDLPLVAFNAEFDSDFLKAACRRVLVAPFENETCCALKMARKAWPDRDSYKLVDIATDGGLAIDDAHRALGDCRRTLTVYVAAAQRLGAYR